MDAGVYRDEQPDPRKRVTAVGRGPTRGARSKDDARTAWQSGRRSPCVGLGPVQGRVATVSRARSRSVCQRASTRERSRSIRCNACSHPPEVTPL